MNTKTSSPVHSNVRKIMQLEEEAERERTRLELVSEKVGAFAGTTGFLIAQAIVVGIWFLWNAEVITGLPIFDPYPFVFLATLLALESVMLTACVLIRQNRMSFRADRRAHLDLQIALLSEQEITKLIQMLDRISNQMGIADSVTDPVTRELAKDTAIEEIAEDLGDQLRDDARKRG